MRILRASIMLLVLALLLTTVPALAQSDYTCDGTDTDVRRAIAAATEAGDFDTADVLLEQAAAVCGNDVFAVMDLQTLTTDNNTARDNQQRQAFIDSATPGIVDLGAFSLFMACDGADSELPTIIFENGVNDPIETWDALLPNLTERTRVCRYYRRGYAPSDPMPDDEMATASQQAADLQLLLETAAIAPPYVLVGHSLGGLHLIAYSQAYPENVSGMVFVDASHPLQFSDYAAQFQSPPIWGLERHDTLGTAAEYANYDLTLVENIPTYVLLASANEGVPAWGAEWAVLQEDHAARYTNSQFETVRSGHYIQEDDPDAVLNAIDWVLAQIDSSSD